MGKCDKSGNHGKSCGHKCTDSTNTPDANKAMLGTEENGNAKNIMCTPMPAGNEMKISFTMEKAGNVDVAIYDNTGNKVSSVFSGNLDANDHSYTVNTSNLSNGTYFYRVSIDGKTVTQKLLISK
jgi:hypothetical protein